MVLRFSTWAKNVTALQILTGTGSILYIKRDPDDGAGDKSIGWILV